jgi:hypothetical protein
MFRLCNMVCTHGILHKSEQTVLLFWKKQQCLKFWGIRQNNTSFETICTAYWTFCILVSQELTRLLSINLNLIIQNTIKCGHKTKKFWMISLLDETCLVANQIMINLIHLLTEVTKACIIFTTSKKIMAISWMTA